MYIRIIKGNYGHANGLYVTVKTPKDKPFEVSDSEALRLAGLKVAKIVEAPSAKKTKEAEVDYENRKTKAAFRSTTRKTQTRNCWLSRRNTVLTFPQRLPRRRS